MRFLLTNDDGVHADGILHLKQALESLGDIFVVAPDRQRSASGHAITLHKPLRLNPSKLRDGTSAFASNGTPTDCVTLGSHIVMDNQVDMVVSGINSGPNLGWDLTYSGTVAGAIEGAILGYPAFAISLVETHHHEEAHYETAAHAALYIARKLIQYSLPLHTFLNVNVPDLPLSDIKGYRLTTLGKRQYADRLEARSDPWGRPYYWLSGNLVEDRDQPNTDVYAVTHGYISITPVHMDFTAHAMIDTISGWFDE